MLATRTAFLENAQPPFILTHLIVLFLAIQAYKKTVEQKTYEEENPDENSTVDKKEEEELEKPSFLRRLKPRKSTKKEKKTDSKE